MSFDVKLKDKVGDEQTYSGVQQVGIPKSDGSGNAWFVEHPYISYNVRGYLDGTEPTGGYRYSGDIAESRIGDEQVFYLKGAISSAGRQIYALKTNSMGLNGPNVPYPDSISPDGYYYLVKVNGDTTVSEIATLFGWSSMSKEPIYNGVYSVVFADEQQFQILRVTQANVFPSSSSLWFNVAQPCVLTGNNAKMHYDNVLMSIDQMRDTITITKNGETRIRTPFGFSGIYSATITTDVTAKSNLQSKNVEITANGTSSVSPDAQYDGLSSVEIVVNVPSEVTTEQVTTNLSMADGDQVLIPGTGKAYSKVTISKPSTMIASNIKNGVDIGGVVGTYEASGGEEQAKTVDLSMADGDQVVTPDAGKTLRQVTITKPTTMIPSNIRKDVNIGGVVGTLDTGGGSADVSNWGDAEGSGSYVYWPNNAGITVYGKGETLGTTDLNYADYLRENLFSITTESPLSALNSWAANVMTSGTAENTAFNKAFNLDNQSLFLGRYLSSKPEFLSSDTKDWNGLKEALYRALGDFKKTLDGWWAAPSISGYVNSFDGEGYYDSTKQSFGFWWGLPSSSSTLESYCKLQTPTGAMPTYEVGFVECAFVGDGLNGRIVFINQNAAGSGNTSEAVLIMLGMALVLYSPVAQTIPAALTNLIFQVEIELSVDAGWSYINPQTFTAVSTTIDYLTDPSLSDYGLYFGNLPYGVLSVLGDEYQRSLFQTNTRNALSTAGYKWGVEFNISKSTT